MRVDIYFAHNTHSSSGVESLSPSSKQEQREELKRLTEEFLANGGTIKQIPANIPDSVEDYLARSKQCFANLK